LDLEVRPKTSAALATRHTEVFGRTSSLKFPGPVRKNPYDLSEIDMGRGAAF
jgi:hypothetical protein